MSDVPDRWAFLQTAWRFACVLTGSPQGAAKVFKDAVQEILRHPDVGNPDRAELLFYTILRRRCLKHPASCDLKGLTANLHRLAEPGRSALALLYLEALPASDIQRLLHLDDRHLADHLTDARNALKQQTEAAPTA